MILPNVRASFGREEAGYVIWLLTRGSESARESAEVRLREEGFDTILDDPRTLNAILAQDAAFSTAPLPLVFYVLVRHALLEHGSREAQLARGLLVLLGLLVAPLLVDLEEAFELEHRPGGAE